MKTLFLAACCAAAFAAPAFADELVISNFIGRVEVVTGNYSQVDVRVIDGPAMRSPDVQRSGDAVRVEGAWRERDWRRGGFGCRHDDGGVMIGDRGGWFGAGDFRPIDDFPVLRVTAPRDVEVTVRRAVLVGELGDIGSGDIGHAGCGELTVGAVSGDLRAAIAGSGTLHVGDVGGSLDANVAGSGDLRAADVRGDLGASIAGSGNIEVGAVAGEAALRIAGSGRVRLGAAEGDVRASIAGSGDMQIAGGQADEVEVQIMGSGNFEFGGGAASARVNTAGSGDVEIARADDADVRVAGSGDVRVNGVRMR